MRIYKKLFTEIVDPQNLFSAWDEFKRGKRSKEDVMCFEKNLEQNIFELQRDLKNKTYKHGGYSDFLIHDPKRRHIHKATVRDRVLHHAVFNVLNRIYEPTFIAKSFSCRVNKGTHKGVLAGVEMTRKVSRNNTRPCFVLKCDVRKFFDTVDHNILLALLKKKIGDKEVLWLLEKIIESFASGYSDLFSPKGVPIGNLTSQLFANVYMNEFDQFMKSTLKIENYARYTDDFIIVSNDREFLAQLVKPISKFLEERLRLSLHPEKVQILKYTRGVDFLGSIIFPHHQKIRKRTWKRIVRKLKEKIASHKKGLITKESLDRSLQSNLGILSHTSSYGLSQEMKNMVSTE